MRARGRSSAPLTALQVPISWASSRIRWRLTATAMAALEVGAGMRGQLPGRGAREEGRQAMRRRHAQRGASQGKRQPTQSKQSSQHDPPPVECPRRLPSSFGSPSQPAPRRGGRTTAPATPARCCTWVFAAPPRRAHELLDRVGQFQWHIPAPCLTALGRKCTRAQGDTTPAAPPAPTQPNHLG
jgi:hypothetical protein